MTTFFLLNLAALLPLAGLGLWLDQSAQRFTPPRDDELVPPASVDMFVRRLGEELAEADRDKAVRLTTYARVVDTLRPAIRRRLAGPLSPERRRRLELLERRQQVGVSGTEQLDLLLDDLESP